MCGICVGDLGVGKVSIDLSGVTVRFGRQSPLFEDLSISLSNHGGGHIIALMGPSGVGKTTFCNVCLGVQRIESGYMTVAPVDAKTAYVPQRCILFDELTIEENIGCLQYSRTLGHTFRPERVREAASAFGLGELLHNATQPSVLSGGEGQRVMLARIQTVDCDLLILDEPCAYLDNRAKETYLAGLRTLVNRKQSLALLVTHVWDEARLIADSILFFDRPDLHPAKVALVSVDDARSKPPTIDVFYQVFWPACRMLELEGYRALVAPAVAETPAGTAHVGIADAERDLDVGGGAGVSRHRRAPEIPHAEGSLRSQKLSVPSNALVCFFSTKGGLLGTSHFPERAKAARGSIG